MEQQYINGSLPWHSLGRGKSVYDRVHTPGLKVTVHEVAGPRQHVSMHTDKRCREWEMGLTNNGWGLANPVRCVQMIDQVSHEVHFTSCVVENDHRVLRHAAQKIRRPHHGKIVLRHLGVDLVLWRCHELSISHMLIAYVRSHNGQMQAFATQSYLKESHDEKCHFVVEGRQARHHGDRLGWVVASIDAGVIHIRRHDRLGEFAKP